VNKVRRQRLPAWQRTRAHADVKQGTAAKGDEYVFKMFGDAVFIFIMRVIN